MNMAMEIEDECTREDIVHEIQQGIQMAQRRELEILKEQKEKRLKALARAREKEKEQEMRILKAKRMKEYLKDRHS